MDLGQFFFEGRILRCSIEDIHQEVSVVMESLSGDKSFHHPLELSEAIVDLPNTDSTSEQKNVLIGFRGKPRKTSVLNSSRHMSSRLRV